MRVIFPLLAFVFIFIGSSLADTIWVEEFDNPSGWWGSGNPPSGWYINDDGTADGNDWHQSYYSPYGNSAFITYSPIQYTMVDIMYGPYVNCSAYTNIKVDIWVAVLWYETGSYDGYFFIKGFDGSSYYDIYQLEWPERLYPGQLLRFNISGWADGKATVAIVFGINLDNSRGLVEAGVDHVVLYTPAIEVKPQSFGKLKAIYL